MKKILITCVAIAVLAGPVGIAQAQNREDAASGAAATHKIGLIDMAYLFSNYEKFKDMREGLRGEIEAREANIKAQVEKLKADAEGLKELKAGSDDQIKLEKALTAQQAKIEAEKQNAKRELFRQESKIYQAVYGEVTEAVGLYAKHYHYTLILRFTREESVGDDPAKVMQALQRQVVFNQVEDDITDKVLKYLNSEYGKSKGTAGPGNPAEDPAVRQTKATGNGTKTARRPSAGE